MSGEPTAAAPLYGLVLAGGRSRRMQRDKATLEYQGRTQLERTMALLAGRTARAFVSVRAEQCDDALRARHALIVDAVEGLGPTGGILAAQDCHPHAAWLVVACDLPFLDGRTLDHLIAERAPERMATAYRSAHDGLPEPLCAIYEPSSHTALASAVQAGERCPRKFLRAVNARLITLPDARALDNVNTPEEFAAAQAALAASGSGGARRRITVQYYALLREQAGASGESVHTSAVTPDELYGELRARHSFTLPTQLLRVAINAEFADWSQPLADGDTVVFIPPVAGG
jgi:molybdopterin-guanine dinucleotide biosynthesis protein A